jgi:hypothetical protein
MDNVQKIFHFNNTSSSQTFRIDFIGVLNSHHLTVLTIRQFTSVGISENEICQINFKSYYYYYYYYYYSICDFVSKHGLFFRAFQTNILY